MAAGKTAHGRTARDRISGGLTTGGPGLVITGTRVMTTPTRLSWMPSRTRLTPATGTPTGLAAVAAGGPAQPTCHQARRVPALSAACRAHLARRARLGRFRAIQRPPSAVLGRAPTMPLAAPGRAQVAPALDRRDRLASVRATLPPGRTYPPPLETRRPSGLVLPGRSPAGSAKRRRRAPGRIPRRVPVVSSKDGRSRMVRRHSSSSRRAATRTGRPRRTGTPPERR